MWGWRAGWTSPSEAVSLLTLNPLPKGEEVLRQLQTLASRGVKVRIAVSKPSAAQPQEDLQTLQEHGELGSGAGLGWAGLSNPAPDHHPCWLQVPRSARWICRS